MLVLLGSLVYPLLVEPLFNSFTPLPDGPLRTRILDLAEQEGVDVDDVLVADASRRTTTLNAYVSGYGSTRRVVVYDNLVEDLGEDETVSVVAHELAHAKHQDVLVGSTLGAAGAALGVGLLALLVPGAGDERDGRRGSRRTLGTCPGSWCSSPWRGCSPARSRTGSAAGWRLAPTWTRCGRPSDPAAFVELQQQLARRSAADLTPPAWSQVWFGSHPTTLMRIALAERMSQPGRVGLETSTVDAAAISGRSRRRGPP